MSSTKIASSRHARPPESDVPESTRNNAALAMIGGAFVGIIALTTPFISMQLRSSLPYMATPRGKVEKALKFLSQRQRQRAAAVSSERNNPHLQSNSNFSHHAPTTQTQQPQYFAKIKKPLNFVDLGSGDGTTILAAASLGWNATGLELNPTLWFISSIRRLFSRTEIRSNSQFILGDMFKSSTAKKSLQSANCVMIFGVLPLMPQIGNMVRRECRPGCYLMSYRFRVPLLADDDGRKVDNNNDNAGKGNNPGEKKTSLNGGGINASLIYDEEEMRIYELDGTGKEQE